MQMQPSQYFELTVATMVALVLIALRFLRLVRRVVEAIERMAPPKGKLHPMQGKIPARSWVGDQEIAYDPQMDI